MFALFQTRDAARARPLPLLKKRRVPLIAPSTGAAVLHAPVNRYLFNFRAMYHHEIGQAVEHFATVHVRTIGLLHVDDAFGQDGLKGARKAKAAHRLTAVASTRFTRVDPDFDATVVEVIKTAPGARSVVSSAKNTAGVIKVIRAKGGQMMIMRMSNNSSQAFVDDLGVAGTGVIISQVTPAPHLISTPLGQEFMQAARNHAVTPSYAAMEGYVNAKVLVEDLRGAGRNLSGDAFVRGLESIQRAFRRPDGHLRAG